MINIKEHTGTVSQDNANRDYRLECFLNDICYECGERIDFCICTDDQANADDLQYTDDLCDTETPL